MLTRPQLHAYLAALGGWSLDALDFFVFVFCLKSISAEFHTDVKAVAEGIFLTLACRPLGALAFGWLAEKYGRRPILMLNVVSYSVLQLATAFAPDLTTLLALRALFGFAMGGEWGVGAALALETLPAKGRGFFSGLLQEGYVIGYLLASVLFATLFDRIGWRGMFILSSASALLVLYIRFGVQESPAWLAGGTSRRPAGALVWRAVRDQFPTLAYLVLLMACFNAFSHGSQDLYPTFLQVQHGFSAATSGTIAIIMNIGALAGGICFGTLSERLGRKRAIALAASLSLPMIPLWASRTPPSRSRPAHFSCNSWCRVPGESCRLISMSSHRPRFAPCCPDLPTSSATSRWPRWHPSRRGSRSHMAAITPPCWHAPWQWSQRR